MKRINKPNRLHRFFLFCCWAGFFCILYLSSHKLSRTAKAQNKVNTTSKFTPVKSVNFSLLTHNLSTHLNKTNIKTEPIEKKEECLNFVSVKCDNMPEKGFNKLPEKFAKNTEKPIVMPECSTVLPWKSLTEIKGNNNYSKMIYIIKSAAGNIQKRNSIRSTWGSIYKLYNAQYSIIFAVGEINKQFNSHEKIQRSVEKENGLYGDILQCKYTDNYKALPIKVISSLNWLNSQIGSKELEVDWITVTDDDCFIDVYKVFNTFYNLKVNENENKIFCGFLVNKGFSPHRYRSSKWYIPKSMYDVDYWPAFCSGPMYTFSLKMLSKLVCASKFTEMYNFYLEDVFTGGILRHKVSCSSDDVVDLVDKNMVQHLMNNLDVKFKKPWKTMMEIMIPQPWHQDGLITIRT